MSHKRNAVARRELEKIYGKGCFFARAKLAEKLENVDEDLSFKRFVEKKIYKGKKISHQITYHHLKHRSEGGKATVENGANLEEVAHQFIHSLPRDKEEIANNMLRSWKMNYLMVNGQEHGTIESDAFDLDVDYISIPLENTKPKQKFNRAKVNQEFRRRIEEDLDY